MRTSIVWRPVPSLPGYIASSDGYLMKVPYEAAMPHGGSRIYGGQPTAGQWDGDRYIIVHKGKTFRVARLICEAFHGPAPFHGAVAMHDDEKSRNNSAGNLKWGTQKENLNYPGFIAYCHGRTGDNSPAIKGMKRRQANDDTRSAEAI